MTAQLTSTDSTVTSPSELSSDLEWIPAVMPGGVHESLLAVGRIPHPFLDDTTSELRWIEHRTWWYRVPLPASPETLTANQRVRLTLPSVDTVATVWFNDVLLGQHATAFRPFIADVTSTVRSSNELIVRIAPPLDGLVAPEGPQRVLDLLLAYVKAAPNADRLLDQPVGLLAGDARLTLRRKPTYSWGWDFAPNLPSVGLLEAPRLTVETGAVISGCHFRTASINGSDAIVAIDVDVETFAVDTALCANVRLTSPSGVEHCVLLSLDNDSASPTAHASAVIAIADAELWWTHDLGEPSLYEVVVELQDAVTSYDTVSFKVGLRTIELDQSADEEQGGRLFRFALNGVPIFARGSNWVPASMLRGSVSPDTVRELISLARDGGQTWLRIWGGGQYEQDAFYETCDELGVLVWQDFMFACFDYPSEDLLLQAEVAKEATYQVRRLRNHPCIAVWSGNNEVEVLHQSLCGGSLEPGDWGWHIFHQLLPDAVSRNAPGAIYWPGSPWGQLDPSGPGGQLDGDSHYWEVWHGRPHGPDVSPGEAMHWHRYTDDLGKFSSEFGLQASPSLQTLARWANSAIELGSPALRARIKDVPRSKGMQLIRYEIGAVDNLEQYVEYSMACQAEGLKFGIEHYRRRQPHNGGTLVWQYNDAWPGFSWSVVDYDLVPKAAYYFLHRAYAPVLASFHVVGEDVELWVTNSGATEVPLDLSVQIAGFDGQIVVDEEVAHLAGPDSSAAVWRSSAIAADRFAWVCDRVGRLPANRKFFARLGDLPLGSGVLRPECTMTSSGRRAVRLEASGYCYFAHLIADRRGVRFSQNYLDLRDGDSAEIEVAGLPTDMSTADVLSVRSWGSRTHPWLNG